MVENIAVKLCIDFELLKEQKLALYKLTQNKKDKKDIGKLKGLICLLDGIQDQAVDNNGIPEKFVFNFRSC